MSSKDQNLSEHENLPSGKGKRFGIVVSEWNGEITSALYQAARETLLSAGVGQDDMTRRDVPGSFELVRGAQQVFVDENVDAVICLGCIIEGETKHNEFIAQAVANGIISLSIKYESPFIFGVLTPSNMQQAKDRAGGKHGNKGVEAAATALKMLQT